MNPDQAPEFATRAFLSYEPIKSRKNKLEKRFKDSIPFIENPYFLTVIGLAYTATEGRVDTARIAPMRVDLFMDGTLDSRASYDFKTGDSETRIEATWVF